MYLCDRSRDQDRDGVSGRLKIEYIVICHLETMLWGKRVRSSNNIESETDTSPKITILEIKWQVGL